MRARSKSCSKRPRSLAYSLRLHLTYRAFCLPCSGLDPRRRPASFLLSKQNLLCNLGGDQPLMWLFLHSGCRRVVCAAAAAAIISALTVCRMWRVRQQLCGDRARVSHQSGDFPVLVLALAAGFSVPLSRNLLKHCSIYSAYFLANNVAFLPCT